MRKGPKVALISVAVLFAIGLLFVGTMAVQVGRHVDMHTATQIEASKEFDAIRATRATGPALVEIDAQTGDVKVNRVATRVRRPISTLYVASWNGEDNEVFRTQAPIWLLRMSPVNILSNLGVAPARFRVTFADLERFGPGLILDQTRPDRKRVLVWAE